jgi:hypothetical protein
MNLIFSDGSSSGVVVYIDDENQVPTFMNLIFSDGSIIYCQVFSSGIASTSSLFVYFYNLLL